MSDPIRAVGNKKSAEAADKSSSDVILTVLYCAEQPGRGRDDKVEGCLPVTFLTTMWSSVVVAQVGRLTLHQAGAHDLDGRYK